MAIDWKAKIQAALQSGPKRTGELIETLGFSSTTTHIDSMTQLGCFRPLRGSFMESQAQKMLGRMVKRNEVLYRRAANMDNWYALPNQKFPRQAAPRRRTLLELAIHIFANIPQALLTEEQRKEWRENVDAIRPDDVWVEFPPFILQHEPNGWSVADGDSGSGFVGFAFVKEYPMDVDAMIVARKIAMELRKAKSALKQ